MPLVATVSPHPFLPRVMTPALRRLATAPHQASSNRARVQKFDWIKDATPEEEALMKTRQWDVEGTALGPVDERYLQPELKVLEEDYETSMRTAREAARLAKSYTAGAEVRSPLVALCMPMCRARLQRYTECIADRAWGSAGLRDPFTARLPGVRDNRSRFMLV
jgi:hypothetical protein